MDAIKDWKTTVIGIFAAIVAVLGFMGVFNYGDQVELNGFFAGIINNLEPIIGGVTGIILIFRAKWHK